MEGYQVISFKKILLCDIEDRHELKLKNSLQLNIEEIPSTSASFEELPSSPPPDEVVELLSDESNDNNDHEEIAIAREDNNSLEVLGYLSNNDPDARNVTVSCDNDESNVVRVQQSTPSNNSFDTEFDRNNLMQLGTLHTSNELNIDQNVQQNTPSNNDSTKFNQNNSMQLFTLHTRNELKIDQNGQIKKEALENCTQDFSLDFIASQNFSSGVIDLSDAEKCKEIPLCSVIQGVTENCDPPDVSYRRKTVPSKVSIDQYISYICPQCGIDCGSADKWKLHTEIEHDFGSFEAANVQSIVNKHGEYCHKCRDCPKMFELTKSFTTLITHRITHLPFKDTIACRICSAKYRTKGTLKRHLQSVHEVLKVNKMPKIRDIAFEYIRFFCPICKEEQNNIVDWRAHVKEKHDYFNKARSRFEHICNDIYICIVCRLSVRASHLVEHMQIHENFKSFLCTACNLFFPQLRTVVDHVRYKHLTLPKELLCNQPVVGVCTI